MQDLQGVEVTTPEEQKEAYPGYFAISVSSLILLYWKS